MSAIDWCSIEYCCSLLSDPSQTWDHPRFATSPSRSLRTSNSSHSVETWWPATHSDWRSSSSTSSYSWVELAASDSCSSMQTSWPTERSYYSAIQALAPQTSWEAYRFLSEGNRFHDSFATRDVVRNSMWALNYSRLSCYSAYYLRPFSTVLHPESWFANSAWCMLSITAWGEATVGLDEYWSVAAQEKALKPSASPSWP